MAGMTPQEIFTTVKTHLLNQNRQAKLTDNPEGMCAYHADNGDMCAVGCLIPSHLYRPEMEEKPIDKLFLHYPNVAEHIGVENLRLLENLQDLHDHTEPHDWANCFGDIADDYELQP